MRTASAASSKLGMFKGVIASDHFSIVLLKRTRVGPAQPGRERGIHCDMRDHGDRSGSVADLRERAVHSIAERLPRLPAGRRHTEPVFRFATSRARPALFDFVPRKSVPVPEIHLGEFRQHYAWGIARDGLRRLSRAPQRTDEYAADLERAQLPGSVAACIAQRRIGAPEEASAHCRLLMADQINRGHIRTSRVTISEIWHVAPRQSPVTP